MKNKDSDIIIGRNLRRIRRSRSMTIAQVSDYMGMHPDTIRRYERGERSLSAADMIRITEMSHCSEQNILNGLIKGRENSSGKEIRQLDDYESGVMRFLATDFPGNPKSTIVALDLYMHLCPERRKEVVMAICLQEAEAIACGELVYDDEAQTRVDYLHKCLGYLYDI